MIGILCATHREAAPLIRALGAVPLNVDRPRTWSFPSPEGGGVLLVSGVGPRRAAEGAEQLVTVHGVDEILNVGICGALNGEIPLRQLCWIDQATESTAPETVWKAGQRPADDTWRALPSLRLVTSPEPVFSKEKRSELSAYGDVVDMEGAAIAAVASRHGISWTFLKGVSDRADAKGPLVLRRQIDSLSKSLARLVKRGLTGTDEPSSPPSPRMSLSALFRFVKVEHTVFSLPLLFSGAWIAAGYQWPSVVALLLIAVAGVGARVLGMAMNRYFDRDLDALNPRTASRELPSGSLTPRAALGVAAGGLALYLAACALLGPLPLLLSPIPAAVLIGYSLLKRFTSYCHFGIGASLALAPAGAHVAVAGHLQPEAALILLTMFTFLWITAFDIIYALQDIGSDRRHGVHSLPAALGSTRAQVVAALLHGGALTSAGGMAWLAGGVAPWIAWGCLGVTLAAAYWPAIPLATRFFPLSALAGFAGALVPLLGSG